jgi:PKD repeat protein
LATVPLQGTAQAPISFSASTVLGPFCGPGSPAYDWDFGDGSPHGNGSGPSHAYTVAGNYNWSVTASAAGANCTQNGAITVAAPTLPPAISSMSKQGNPFRISVNGTNLQNGIRVFIDGAEWTNIQYKSATLIKLKGGGSLKALVPKNTPTTFRFDNPDGGSQTFVWQWP